MSTEDKRPGWFDTPESRELAEVFKKISIKNEKDANDFWEGLSYEDKCNAFHAVVSRLHKGEVIDGGSYRYVLYDIFGFDLDMYTRGMDCGYIDLHNSIMTKDEYDEIRKRKI